MADQLEEARHQLAMAERTATMQRERIAALADPVTGLASRLHAVLGCRWCSEPLHFEPGWSRTGALDGWAISQEHVNRMYMGAARRVLSAVRGRASDDVIADVVAAVSEALKAGDAERFR